MKTKFIAVTLSLMLLVVCFAGCTQTTTTNVNARWGEETLVYNISLNKTASGYIKANEDDTNTQSVDDVTYYRDYTLTATDEICPNYVSGTLTVRIYTAENGNTVVETNQVIYAGYNNETYQLYKDVDGLSEIELDNTAKQSKGFDSSLHFVENKSKTSCEFLSAQAQTPVKSAKSVKGLYVGKQHCEVTNITYTANYDLSNSKVTVKVNDGEEVTNELDSTKIIDCNQLLTYTRSYDKNSDNFQDSPSVTLYDPLANSTSTVTFGFTYNANAILTKESSSANSYVKLTQLAVKVNGVISMYQLSIPSDVSANVGDTIYVGGTQLEKLTPIRYITNYYSYECLQDDSVLEELAK